MSLYIEPVNGYFEIIVKKDELMETWKPVVGFEGQYEVSDQGRVRSLDRTVFRRASSRTKGFWVTVKGRILRPGPSNYGHMSVVLGRAQGTRMVHALVLEAFVGPRLEREECRHLDGNPKNNKLENLRWGTRSENIKDAIGHGTWNIGNSRGISISFAKNYKNIFGEKP